jgi:hypothetical protein
MLLICRLCQQIDRKLIRRLAAFQIVFKLKTENNENNETGKGKRKLQAVCVFKPAFQIQYNSMSWRDRVTEK